MMLDRRSFTTLAAASLIAPTAARALTPPVLVIAHRGASGERPEHTLMAYRLAIEQGAHAIEPDLVVTRDGHLVCRHESGLADTTDVASRPEFAARSRDGRWLAEDFTLAEFQTLRARERIPNLRPGSARFDGREAPPSFQQVIDLVKAESARTGRPIALYPELKQAAELKAKGWDTGQILLDQLAAAGLPSAQVHVYIQSFEPEALMALRGRTGATIVQTTSDPALLTEAGLAQVATYAQGLGPEKRFVTPQLVQSAFRHGLVVHPWTFRAENNFLPAELRVGTDPAALGDMAGEIRRYLAMGVGGFFTDHPALAVAALS